MRFKLKSSFQPTGDQPQAIKALTQEVLSNTPHQTLLGVTGSGKTFTIANLIANTNLPTLVISHNKTLAAQLYQEFRDFFPQNAVSYFVSYYDYYQPEAYIPQTDTYIEKETNINDEIDKLRLSATANLLTRPDVIVIASVSCIYNLGSPVEYGRYVLELIEGQLIDQPTLLARLIDLQYERSDYEFRRGSFRLKGDTLQLWPAYKDHALKFELLDNTIQTITTIDPVSGKKIDSRSQFQPKRFTIYPAKHYFTNPKTHKQAFEEIRKDLKAQIKHFKSQNKLVESYRIEQRVNYDLEAIKELGFVNGIENYSRYFDGRESGDPPFTLLDYFHHNAQEFDSQKFLTIIDESHVTIPQIGGMYRGDKSRKETLIDFGFRLPAAIDNRPLRFSEFQNRVPQLIYTSATPNDWEISQSGGVIEQLIRPTGIPDPNIQIRTAQNQVPDLIKEIINRIQKKQRVLVTTLTKRMAEALTDYLNDENKLKKLVTNLKVLPKAQYLHADIATLDRTDILQDLRKGEYDVVVGINLLREGLDLPEVSLVAILDADKEGFLRSTTSLIQTMGRAARHQDGLVIMYADKTTKSMKAAIAEVTRRRNIQLKYNRKHNITPKSIQKPIRDQLIKRNKPQNPRASVIQLSKKEVIDLANFNPSSLTPQDKKKLIRSLTRKMNSAAKQLDFELAALLRDTIEKLE